MTFEFTSTDDGFRIRDTIENTWSDVTIGRSVNPRPTDTVEFRAPLDVAVAVDSTTLQFDQNFNVVARTPDGEFVDRGRVDKTLELDPGDYELDAWFTPFKLYFSIRDAAITVTNRPEGGRLEFEAETTVTIGLRSFHQQPAGTVSASQDPRELMAAVSTFGSALKTHSPERAFPTLRGHPPEIAIRGRTNIPDTFAAPDTGITIEVPPAYDQIFTVAPLAYYLGATVEPGHDPRIVTAGAVHSLDEATLTDDVFDVLRHTVLLDCVVRTEGLLPIDLYERSRLEERTTIDATELYDLPLDERTARYLEIPFEATTDLLTWPAVVDIDPVPLNAEALPYLAYHLTAVRSPPSATTRPTRPPSHPTGGSGIDGQDGTDASRHRELLSNDPANSLTVVDPDPYDAHHHLWIADGVPAGGVKPTLGAYLRSLDSTSKDAAIDRHVVCADGTDPAALETAYGTVGAEDTPVTIHENPTTNELRDLLTTDIDYLHFVGDVSANGFECTDGALDVRTLPTMGVSAFLLDGASSYQQGLALIHAGGIAGGVTLEETDDTHENGRLFARLLDFGFTIAGAAEVLARTDTQTEYTVVGDGTHQVCLATGMPIYYEAHPERATTDEGSLTAVCDTTTSHRVGSSIEFSGDTQDQPRLVGTHHLTFTRDSLAPFVDAGTEPILVDGDLFWLDELSADELWKLLR